MSFLEREREREERERERERERRKREREREREREKVTCFLSFFSKARCCLSRSSSFL